MLCRWREAARPPRSAGSRAPTARWHPDRFLAGANLPWVSYGNDFGASAWYPRGGLAASPAAQEAADRALARAADEGLEIVRWFVLCDGRAGVRFGERGIPIGLDDRVPADLEAAMDVSYRRGVRLLLVLFDFHWCLPERRVSGVQLGGRRNTIAGGSARAALAERVVVPLLERFGREPAVFGWDLFNEPEWITWGFGGRGCRRLAPWLVRDWLAGLVRVARASAEQPVTVGLASAGGLPLCRGLGLDFYQVHWYEHIEDEAPLDRPVARLGLDRPLVLGEFPARGPRSPSASFEAARGAGYAGALLWSLLARDAASGPPRT